MRNLLKRISALLLCLLLVLSLPVMALAEEVRPKTGRGRHDPAHCAPAAVSGLRGKLPSGQLQPEPERDPADGY